MQFCRVLMDKVSSKSEDWFDLNWRQWYVEAGCPVLAVLHAYRYKDISCYTVWHPDACTAQVGHSGGERDGTWPLRSTTRWGCQWIPPAVVEMVPEGEAPPDLVAQMVALWL